VARYFGMRSYATIYGSLYGCFALGAGVGPLLFGNAFDKTHSYSHMLVVSCVILVAAALMLLTLGRYRRFGPDPLQDSKIAPLFCTAAPAPRKTPAST
jgi:hypothetical protein